jgi:hypothetical protein
LKKKKQKNFCSLGMGCGGGSARGPAAQKFLVLFFKKELLT